MKAILILSKLFTVFLITSCITIEVNDDNWRTKDRIDIEQHWDISNNGEYLHVWGFITNHNNIELENIEVRIQVYKSHKGDADVIEYFNVYDLQPGETIEFNETLWVDNDFVDDVDVKIWNIE